MQTHPLEARRRRDTHTPPARAQDIGGYDIQKQEIREAVELPLTQGDLYRQLGIDPPRWARGLWGGFWGGGAL